MESSLASAPTSSELLASLGLALSLLVSLLMVRSWASKRKKKDDYWQVERQKGGQLVPILLLCLTVAAIYGLAALLESVDYGVTVHYQSIDLPGLLPYVALAAVTASSLAAVSVFRSSRRGGWDGPALPADGESDGRKVSGIIAKALRELRAGSDYRATILDCYRAMCAVLSRNTDTDGSKLTAREFESLVTRRLGVNEQNLHAATLLFEKARYSSDPVSDAEANKAESCLKNLMEEARGLGLKPIGGAVRIE